MVIDTEEAVEITAPRARQGYRGRRIVWVLVASLALVSAALFGTWAIRSNDLATADQPTVTDKGTAESINAPEGLAPPKRPG